MQIVTQNRIPAYSWCKDIEEGAFQQISNLTNLPFAFHHIAIMPDCHQGFGMPIGGVLATKGVIIPNAVGVDIGCGMTAIQTSLKKEELTRTMLLKIMQQIREAIPVGFSHHSRPQDKIHMPESKTYVDFYGEYKIELSKHTHPIVWRENESALKQIGTLGGGNHFIEIQYDQDDFVWIMIHSGSRNLGKQICDHYNKLARAKNYFPEVPSKWDLAGLSTESPEGILYIDEMRYALHFAGNNRNLMMHRIMDILRDEFKERYSLHKYYGVHHNYAALAEHFGEEVWIHRKGATAAYEGGIGIIPGSQGTSSYIVKGKGNPDSFMSCSHGAGRAMSRSAAKKNLKIKDEQGRLDKLGIIHAIRNEKDLDEAAGAYKSIDEVMRQQIDLVEIVTTLKPMAVIKG